ncbi:MAG: Clp protease [Shinella sp.]|jgi:peptidoglycan hydrolase CwlO-like protein|nr:MAG: Clp protease [Shinella sp.]
MILDTVAISSLIGLIFSSMNLMILVKNLLSAGEKKIDERVQKAEAKLVDLDRRVQNVEGELGHLPKATALHELELNMEKLNAQIAVLTESLKPIRANAELINDLLREQVKK